MNEEMFISRQITKYVTTKKLLEFNDKMRLSPIDYYAHIQACGDRNKEGRSVTSLIGIKMLDYSNGKGDKTVTVEANMAPDELMFVLTNIKRGALSFETKQEKIIGEPDKDGKCKVTKLLISRSSKEGVNYPWVIEIANGKAVKAINASTGGSYIKSGTYIEEAKVRLNLNDYDLFKQLWRVEHYINAWEYTYAPQRICRAKEIMSQNAKEREK